MQTSVTYAASFARREPHAPLVFGAYDSPLWVSGLHGHRVARVKGEILTRRWVVATCAVLSTQSLLSKCLHQRTINKSENGLGCLCTVIFHL